MFRGQSELCNIDQMTMVLSINYQISAIKSNNLDSSRMILLLKQHIHIHLYSSHDIQQFFQTSNDQDYKQQHKNYVQNNLAVL